MKLMTRFGACLLLAASLNAAAALPTHDSQNQPLPSLAPMLQQVNPAVVNIATFSTRQAASPLMNDPFFRRFFSMPGRNHPQPQPQSESPVKRQQSAGSGVIVDADKGIVITNHHVIKGADEVQVSLIDGRSFTARVKGGDPDLDIAVLEIDAEDLTEIPLANSDGLKVGDFAVAIGNPFGLGQTVTTGVVSALGRSGLGIEGYENFIQTDASINPGNSGGALVNLRGELIGINTAIISPAGGNVGIGFAIPTNMARASVDQILAHGRVERGMIGVGIQDITPQLREAFALDRGVFGVLVTNLSKNGPAEKAGLQVGDIILSVNGNSSRSTSQIRSQIGVVTIGDEADLVVWRDGDEMAFSVEVAKLEDTQQELGRLSPVFKGVSFAYDERENAVQVVHIEPRSPAAQAGLRKDDRIVSVNRKRLPDLDTFVAVAKASKQPLLMQVERQGRYFFIAV